MSIIDITEDKIKQDELKMYMKEYRKVTKKLSDRYRNRSFRGLYIIFRLLFIT